MERRWRLPRGSPRAPLCYRPSPLSISLRSTRLSRTGWRTAEEFPSLMIPIPLPASAFTLKSIIGRASRNIGESCTPSGLSPISLTARTTSASGTTSTRRHTRRIMESSSDPDSDDALPRCAYQELLEAFHQRPYISINLADGTKLGNGFTELIDYAITQRCPALGFLSTTVTQHL